MQLKKFRQEYSMFVIEGAKRICELQDTDFEIIQLFCTQKYLNLFGNWLTSIEIISETELQNISSLENNYSGLALVRIKPQNNIKINSNDLTLVLDNIQDPGNFGTIIRTADWFGIKAIFCSENTVDLYNPKVICATMGSFARVSINYTCLNSLLKEQTNLPIYGAFVEGESTKNISTKNGILVLGNESNGVSSQIASLCTHRISIPKFGHAESLNVGVATGILLYSFKI